MGHFADGYPTIIGIGGALPERVITNTELIEAYGMDSSDEWIRAHTHIQERRWADSAQPASVLGTLAAERALSLAGDGPINSLTVSTLTPDQLSPSVATLIHEALGLSEDCSAVDLNAACAGAIYGLRAASNELQVGGNMDARSLVVGTEILSALTNTEDRRSAILFGDGAGAMVLGLDPDAAPAHFAFLTKPDRDAIQVRSGGTVLPAEPGDPTTKIEMNGKQVAGHALDIMPRAAQRVADQAGLYDPEKGINWDQIDLLVPHQANGALIEEVGKVLGVPEEKCVVTVAQHGNTSSASIPLALAHAVEAGVIPTGERKRVLMTAIGAGMVGGAVLMDVRLGPSD